MLKWHYSYIDNSCSHSYIQFEAASWMKRQHPYVFYYICMTSFGKRGIETLTWVMEMQVIVSVLIIPRNFQSRCQRRCRFEIMFEGESDCLKILRSLTSPEKTSATLRNADDSSVLTQERRSQLSQTRTCAKPSGPTHESQLQHNFRGYWL